MPLHFDSNHVPLYHKTKWSQSESGLTGLTLDGIFHYGASLQYSWGAPVSAQLWASTGSTTVSRPLRPAPKRSSGVQGNSPACKVGRAVLSPLWGWWQRHPAELLGNHSPSRRRRADLGLLGCVRRSALAALAGAIAQSRVGDAPLPASAKPASGQLDSEPGPFRRDGQGA